MARVTVHHLTLPERLPLIEEAGLRTRADLSSLLGALSEFDAGAPGTFANGRRVTGWLSYEHAMTTVEQLGAGYVSYTVDPAKTLAASASERGDVTSYWQSACPLTAWLDDGDPPDDLEVHQNVPVRAKHLRIHAPRFADDVLGDYAPLVDAVADDDRLSAKALMHLAIIACEGDFGSVDFRAACALAWRDEPDPAGLHRELIETDPDKVASAALAEHGALAPQLTARLREVLEETRAWAEESGMTDGEGLLERSGAVLDLLDRGR